MSAPQPPILPRRRAASGFQPRFALGIIYFLAFFFLLALLFVLPELLDVLETVPPGPEQEELARDAAHRAIGGKLYLALAGAMVAVGVGGWLQVLPGLKPPA